MPRLFDDLRWALRSLLKTPVFTATAVLILALGIGANAAIFSLVDRTLLRPLPFREPDRLMAVWESVPARDAFPNPLSVPDFLDWQREAGQFEGMAAVYNDGVNLTGDQEPMIVPAGRISWNFFSVIGVGPVLGRGFLPEEDRAEGPKAVILSHEFWTRRFGADPGLLGRSIRLDGLDTQVVGILPPGFRFQHYLNSAQILLPAAFPKNRIAVRGAHFMGAVGRLKPGATRASAEQELKGIAARLATAYPDTNKNFTARLVPLQDQVVVNARQTLLVLAGAVVCVLLIACANLMNLMLARAARRQREMAIRAALGAGPATLVWTALAESLVLGLLGGAVGLLLARWTLSGLATVLGPAAAGPGPLTLDLRLVLFTFGLSVGASLVFGVVPAMKVEGLRLADSLKEGKGSGTSTHPRLRGLLVASETALATALLIGAGLMLRSFLHLQAVDPGFRADHVLIAQVVLPPYKYTDPAARAAFVKEFVARLGAAPGVVSAGVNDTPPLMGSTSSSSYDVAGKETVDGQEAIHHCITPGYFRTMGIPILQGRDLEPGETGAVVISEAMARREFPHGNPLEGRISLDRQSDPFLPVVGVVGNVRHQSLANEAEPEMYFPALDTRPGDGLRVFSVVLRTVPAPEALLPVLRNTLREMDPDLPLGNARPMDAALVRDRKGAQSRSILLGTFAGLALLLAGVGIFAVVNFLTALRTREIGVRMAMGAQVRDVLNLVVGQGLRMTLAGVAVGLAAALALGRTVASQLVGVSPWDPSTLGSVAVLLAGVGALACLLPALKAARVDPMVALRNE